MPIVHITTKDDTEHTVEIPVNKSILDACRKASLPMDGLCGGELDCSTCHVVVDPQWFERLNGSTEDEEDMLDLIPTLTDTSRLGCQIKMTDELSGLKVKLA